MTRSWMLSGALAVLAFAGTPAHAAPPAKSDAPGGGSLTVINATVQVGDGTVIENATLRIVDGKFGPIGGAAGGGTTFDAKGKLVTPGLIAADTQLGLVEIGLEASTHDDSRGDGLAIKSGYDPSSALNADSSLLAVQAIEGVTTAAVSPVGGLVSGQITWIDLLPGRHGQLVADTAIGVSANLGLAFASSRAAGISELEKVFEDAAWYRLNQRNFDRGQARELAAHPVDLRGLWPVIDRQVPLVIHANRASDLLALIELAKDLDVRITIVGAAEGWKVADRLADAKITVIVQPTQNLPGSFETLGARLDNAALLAGAGVTIAIAHFDSYNARNMTQEVGVAIANGLDAKLGLTTITLNVAKAYGMDRDYGTIATGKVANLVVWDGSDPFELSCWPEQVIVRGELLDMRSRQTELRDRYLDLGEFRP